MSCNFNFEIVCHLTNLWVLEKKQEKNKQQVFSEMMWFFTYFVVMKMDVRHQMACLWACSEWWASRSASPLCHQVFTCVKTPGWKSEKLSTSTFTFQIVQMCSLLHCTPIYHNFWFLNVFVCVHVWSTKLTCTWIYM